MRIYTYIYIHWLQGNNTGNASCYFDRGSGCQNNASVIRAAAEVTSTTDDVILYVGEYGSAGPNFTGPSAADQIYPSQVLDVQVNY